MARGRKKKPGFEWLKRDVRISLNRKIKKARRICREQYTYGSLVQSVYEAVLDLAVETTGYYLEWEEEDDATLETLVEYTDLPEQIILPMLDILFQVKLLDKSMFDKFHILTSEGFQERQIDRCEGKKDNGILPEHRIDTVFPESENTISDAENAIFGKKIPQTKNKTKTKREMLPPPIVPPPPHPAENVVTEPDTEYRPRDDTADTEARLGFVDHLDEIFEAWNTHLDGPNDPRHYEHLMMTGVDRYHLGESWKQFPDVATFRKVFEFAIRQDDFAWTFGAAIKPANIRLLLTKMKVSKQRKGRDSPGKPSMYVSKEEYTLERLMQRKT